MTCQDRARQDRVRLDETGSGCRSRGIMTRCANIKRCKIRHNARMWNGIVQYTCPSCSLRRSSSDTFFKGRYTGLDGLGLELKLGLGLADRRRWNHLNSCGGGGGGDRYRVWYTMTRTRRTTRPRAENPIASPRLAPHTTTTTYTKPYKEPGDAGTLCKIPSLHTKRSTIRAWESKSESQGRKTGMRGYITDINTNAT